MVMSFPYKDRVAYVLNFVNLKWAIFDKFTKILLSRTDMA